MAAAGTVVVGTVECGNCKSMFAQSDIASGLFDTKEQTPGIHLNRANAEFQYYIGPRTAAWGDRHSIGFSCEYSDADLTFLLDGNLFPVGSNLTEAECRRVVEANMPSGGEEALNLTIRKLILSYAVRNNVNWKTAEAELERAMGW